MPTYFTNIGFTMKTFVIDDCQMRYLDQGQGEVLVFGHSYLWDSAMWAPQVEALSQHYRCIVPDLWAHGQSDFAPSSMNTLKDYAQHILALMDHLSIEQFSIIGLSVGGMWGAELAVLAPARVKSLVMMDTFVGLEPEVSHAKYFAMLDAIAAMQQVPLPIVDAVVPMFFAKDGEQQSPTLVAGFKQHLSALTGQQAVEVARLGKMIFGRRDMIEEVEQLRLPVLIAAGAEDMPRPPLEAYLMNDAIHGSELEVIANAGHISNLEQPEYVTAMLTRFLKKALS
ncbi:alpha/beta fold hydrolase [Vibrio sp. B1-2]|uniref:alpha/beta fold hydrolase n=1 Tax=Vibrio sp. B1-2 TaxID=2591465 RepID=UPI001481D8AA|nr:alpha/beta fold hydrolase [Vibrio sp. B1-2]NNN99765.1 alpha/beta fold hydrolase [Vibrio sp. B1-2]